MKLGWGDVFWMAAVFLVALAFVLYRDTTPARKVQVFLYPHEAHECVVEVYSNDTWVWMCDDGCSYVGAWTANIENHLQCPLSEDEND